MYSNFEELPASARVWIYQANSTLNDDDMQAIEEIAQPFFDQWAAHGAALKSSFKIFHNKFLVIAVDESHNAASGCSIDASVALVRELAQKLHVDFFDRTNVCFFVNDEIFESPMTGIKELVSNGSITESTLTFNNLVPTVGELNDNWLIPAKESWLKRYFG